MRVTSLCRFFKFLECGAETLAPAVGLSCCVVDLFRRIAYCLSVLHLVALAGVKPPRKSATRDWITYTARETEAAYYLGGGGACSTSVRATVLFSIELII